MAERAAAARRPVVAGGSRTTFQRIHADALIETARVLSVSRDSYGIPHVKFQVSFRRPNRSTFDEANRMHALQAFADRFKDMAPA